MEKIKEILSKIKGIPALDDAQLDLFDKLAEILIKEINDFNGGKNEND